MTRRRTETLPKWSRLCQKAAGKPKVFNTQDEDNTARVLKPPHYVTRHGRKDHKRRK